MKKEKFIRKASALFTAVLFLFFGMLSLNSCSEDPEVKNVYSVDVESAQGWYGCCSDVEVKYYEKGSDVLVSDKTPFYIYLISIGGNEVSLACSWESPLGGFCYEAEPFAEIEEVLLSQPIYHVEKLVGNSMEIFMQNLTLNHRFDVPVYVKGPNGVEIQICEISADMLKSEFVTPVNESVIEGNYIGQSYVFEKTFTSKEEYDAAVSVDYLQSADVWESKDFELRVELGKSRENGSFIYMVGTGFSQNEKGKYNYLSREVTSGKVVFAVDDLLVEYPKTVTKKWDAETGTGVISGYGFVAQKVQE